MRVLIFAALAAAAMAEDRPAARRLLDSIPEMAAAVDPETGVIALWRAGAAYAQLDKSKAMEYLRQAFSTAAALPENAGAYRIEIVRAAADVSLPDAIEMLPALAEPAAAADKIATLLVARQEFDQAIEMLALTPDSAEYPFRAAGRVFEKLPPGDPRRALVFGRAVAAYARRSAGPFPDLLERYGSQVSRQLVAQAVAAIASRIGEWKDDTNSLHGSLDGGGPVEMHSPNQVELRELMTVLRQFDARRADEILASRGDVRAVLGGFGKERTPPAAEPEPSPNENADDGSELSPPLGMGSASNLDEFTKRLQDWSALDGKIDKVFETLKKDPRKAFEEARDLPAAVRAEVLARIARSASAGESEWARSLLDTCLSLVREIRDPGERVNPLRALAEAFHQLKDEARSFEALERAMGDLDRIYAHDTNAGRPNRALRDHWPSIQGCRMAARSAAKILGVKAEALFAGIRVPDLALVARIEIARALLGQPLDVHRIEVRW